MDIKHVEATADALVKDVVETVRKHPQYAQLVNKLVEDALGVLAAQIGV